MHLESSKIHRSYHPEISFGYQKLTCVLPILGDSFTSGDGIKPSSIISYGDYFLLHFQQTMEQLQQTARFLVA